MSTAKFTPGPWRSISNGLTKPSIAKIPTQTLAIESAGPIICELWTPKRNRDRVADVSEVYANEGLIAAAPDLYAALEAALPFIDDAMDVHDVFPESAAWTACRDAVVVARAALAKARGER